MQEGLLALRRLAGCLAGLEISGLALRHLGSLAPTDDSPPCSSLAQPLCTTSSCCCCLRGTHGMRVHAV